MPVDIYQKKVRDAMTRGADTILDQDSIHSAIEKMVNLGLSALPVINDLKECVGVLTKTDIIKLAGALDEEDQTPHRNVAALFFGVPLDALTEVKVKDLMTAQVIVVEQEDLLTDAANKMLRYEIHHVPVCTRHREVVGMVSSMDVLKAI